MKMTKIVVPQMVARYAYVLLTLVLVFLVLILLANSHIHSANIGDVNSKNGLIINLGSFAGLVPTPFLSVYSGSKAFLSSWSQAIGAELAPKGVTVQNVNTYFVVSAMSKIRKANFLIPMPKPYVRSVLGQIGISGGASTPYTSTPYYSHAVANWLIDNVLSRGFWVKKNYDIQVDIRKRALRKREREAAASKSQ